MWRVKDEHPFIKQYESIVEENWTDNELYCGGFSVNIFIVMQVIAITMNGANLVEAKKVCEGVWLYALYFLHCGVYLIFTGRKTSYTSISSYQSLTGCHKKIKRMEFILQRHSVEMLKD